MTPEPWDVEPAGGADDEPGRALAYAAADGAFALYNDYTAGRSVLRRRPGPPGPQAQELVRLWQEPAGPAERALAVRDPVEGYGTFTFPYGPVSMGVPESGRFDVVTYGERVLELAPVGGYKSRRILASLVGSRPEDAALRIERTAGNFSAAHVSAYLAAVESAQGLEVPRTELWVRALAQELQRIYNHVHVLARIAEAASQNVGAAQAHAFAEEMLRLQGERFGHRWLFGALLPGGPARRLGADDRRALAGELDRRSKNFERLWGLFLESRIFVDRIQTTCVVPRERAIRWGAVGPTLRACGVPWDDRLRAPSEPYSDLFVALSTERDGDALARVLVRVQEVRASFLLLEQLLDRWPAELSGSVRADPPVEAGRGLGRVESPSGDLVYDVAVENGRLAHVGVRTPSRANWPVFALGMREAVFTDFHFALESFGLVFADTDG